ncbi:repeat-companion domain protein [Isosphaera pallida ATCC 43644]|uniref:Repeat-companion domain protein n=1 Tax=Isosphaera pallida (strain ATCC 43644 / DSM 9630 / IS1B) TaxID=575540 RepID=E8R012_ISOPI|nr:TIGR02996 domain-containing protein [Isosphaera pallida]ADV61130.1 repeat-companion domain protein [Isosphaera pallida ATCC 43644]
MSHEWREVLADCEPFIEAIRNAPDDDGPVLIYADWLEERGHSERAELIRVQLEAAALADTHPRRAALKRRESQLKAIHRQSPLEDLPDLGGRVIWGGFDRGMVREATFVHVSDFLEVAEDVFRLAPLEKIRFLNLEAKDLGRLADSPTLARVRALDLSEQGLEGSSVSHLTRSPHLGALRELELRSNPLGRSGIQLLASSPRLAGLTRLGLHRVGAGDDAARILAQESYLVRLVELDLSSNPLHFAAAEALAQSVHLNNLRGLNLSSTSIGFAGAAAIARSGLGQRLERFIIYHLRRKADDLQAIRDLMPHALVIG